MRYEIKRDNDVLVTVRPESGEQKKEIMLTDIVSMNFTLPSAVHFEIGDYVEVWAERYYLNTLPEPQKDSSIKHKYALTFQAAWYDLAKPLFFFYDGENNLWSQSEFQIMGTAETLLNLVISNANREQIGWLKGDVDNTETKQLPFSGEETVLQALTQIAEAFNTEWWIINKTIHLVKKGSVSGYNFEYGKNKGLRGGLKRTNVDSSSAFSRLYVRGSDQNLPLNYRGGQKRLMLPTVLPYIQGDKYGAHEIERSVSFDEIKPERTGYVTAVGDKFTFSDTDLPFNINDQLMPGISAKVTFNTGLCAGYKFEILKGGYNHATRTITILKSEEEKAFEMPSDDFKPAIGDEYVLTDIIMPQSYVDDAEERLQIKGLEYHDKNSQPKVAYSVPPDHFYFARNNVVLNLGDYVGIKDFDIEVDKSIRVTGFTRDLHNQYKYTSMTISDTVKGQVINRQFVEAEKLTKALALNRIGDINRARMSWRTGQELLNKYFDPEGNIYTEAISPVTVRTLMIETGARSQQLMLPGIVFTSNYLKDANKVAWTSGRLVHLTIADTPREWIISGAVVMGLDPAKSYYIYGKCEKAGNAGSIIIDETEIVFDQDAVYYHFMIGFVSSVVDNYRDLRDTYGSVRIYGRNIEGGIIFGDQLEINLDEGYVKGKVTFEAGSSGYNNISDKPDLSVFADQALVNAALADLQNQIDGQITSWFYDYEPTLVNAPASDWVTDANKDTHLGDLFYNNLTGYAYRFAKNSGVYLWIRILDTDVVLALQRAQEAQDTADGKRRVFITQPVTPYDAGDLWTDGTDLYRCDNSRASGAFNALDWQKATVYDSTQVTIDNGVITGGTIQLGNTGGINAGITGHGTDDDEVRFWAGETFANRDSAPFRALQDGTVYMTKARISGDIQIGFNSESTSEGFTSGWKLSSSAILNDGGAVGTSTGNNFAIIRGSSKYDNGTYTEFAFATDLIPSSSGGAYSQTGYIRNKRPELGSIPGLDDTTNIALELHASGANHNIGLLISKGDFRVADGNVIIDDQTGISGTWDVRMGGGHFWRMTWRKGVLITAVDMGD